LPKFRQLILKISRFFPRQQFICFV